MGRRMGGRMDGWEESQRQIMDGDIDEGMDE